MKEKRTDYLSPLLLKISSAMIGILLLTASGCDDNNDDNTNPTANKTIVQVAQGNNDLSILVTALTKYPDLVTTLSGAGPFTVFAPSNAAFTSLLSAIGQTSLDDIPEAVLKDVLKYHVVATGAVKSTDLTAGNVTTYLDEDIAVTTAGGIKLNGSTNVKTADVITSNGIVHVIDAVLVPPSIAPIVGTVVAPAYFNKNFTTLIAAVKAADASILTTLLNASNKTLFAPTNDAFVSAGITALPDQATLNAVLAYHVIGSTVKVADIASGSSSAEALNGKIYLSKGASGVFINGNSKVTIADIMASNGVVHVIDRTLIPPSKTIAGIVSEYAAKNPGAQFTKLLAALQRTSGQGANDLLAAAGAAGNLTVFAPTDAAFTASGINLETVPLATLTEVLKHHIVAARVFSSDLATGPVTTLNGNVGVDLTPNPPTVTGSSGGANIANLNVDLLNIHATNGVIHVIDRVLIPAD
ncbi:MAG: fasciclin domain-containing protein [Chryseolinea sp.]